jgi:hypothetical protein
MKKTLTLFAFATLFASQSFATYIVVLKDGTRYEAKAKWTVVKGKALVQLAHGQSLQLDPALIDVAKSEQLTKIGLASANVLDLNGNIAEVPAAQRQSLSGIKLRRQPVEATPAAPVKTAPTPPSGGDMPAMVLDKFERAYENVGIFEKTVKSTGAHSLRAELTVDTEERVFNILSAASFLMVRNAGVDGAQIDVVELFMRTTTGGSAGRFQMSRADAEALDKRTISQQEYFVTKVIY